LQTVQTDFAVARPLAEVYDAVCNIGEFGYVIAGVKEVEILDQDTSIWKIAVRAGMIAQTIVLSGRVTERVPLRRLAFAAEGKDVVMTGAIDLSAIGAAETNCQVAVQAEVTGRLAPIVDLISRTTQKQMIAQTIENFKQKLALAFPA
jgi:carbon monoxide dehydrogenase subunit G